MTPASNKWSSIVVLLNAASWQREIEKKGKAEALLLTTDWFLFVSCQTVVWCSHFEFRPDPRAQFLLLARTSKLDLGWQGCSALVCVHRFGSEACSAVHKRRQVRLNQWRLTEWHRWRNRERFPASWWCRWWTGPWILARHHFSGIFIASLALLKDYCVGALALLFICVVNLENRGSPIFFYFYFFTPFTPRNLFGKLTSNAMKYMKKYQLLEYLILT